MDNRHLDPNLSLPDRAELAKEILESLFEFGMEAATHPVDFTKGVLTEVVDYVDTASHSLTLAHRQGIADLRQEVENVQVHAPVAALFDYSSLALIAPAVYVGSFFDRLTGRKEIPVSEEPNLLSRLISLPRKLNDYLDQQLFRGAK